MTTADHPEPSLTAATAPTEDVPSFVNLKQFAAANGLRVRNLKRAARIDGAAVVIIGREWLLPRSWLEQRTQGGSDRKGTT